MLVLSRRPGEKLRIDDDITITVLSVQGNRVRLGIEAPDRYRVLRAEIAPWVFDQPAKGRSAIKRSLQATA